MDEADLKQECSMAEEADLDLTKRQHVAVELLFELTDLVAPV